MITKLAYDITGREVEVDWHWAHASGDWWVEIETIDDHTDFNLVDEALEAIRYGCADAYPLAQYQSEAADDAAYADYFAG